MSTSLHHCTARRLMLAARYIAAAALFGCPTPPNPAPRAVTALAVVPDLSISAAGGPQIRCSELVARVRQALATPGVRRLDVLVLGTGDFETALEPVIVLPWTRWEPTSRLYEKPGRAEAARDEWIASLGTRCGASAHATKSSPVFAAIARAAESIRAHCTEIEGRNERCERRMLAVHSDLRENGERAIGCALDAAAMRPRARRKTVLEPLPKIDLAGIEITVCGVANTILPGDTYIPPAALFRVWSSVLGPGTPAFDAACPAEPTR